MKIDKVMNNNVVSSIDEDGQEIIVVGTGIGFQGKEGKVVDEKKIQKIFRLEDPKMIRKLKEILQDLPMEQFEISTAIIEHAKQSLGTELNENIYVTLTDHIHCISCITVCMASCIYSIDHSWSVYCQDGSCWSWYLCILKPSVDPNRITSCIEQCILV